MLISLSFTSRFVCIRSDKVVISQSLFIQLTMNYTKAIPESFLETWFLIKPPNREKYKQQTISALFKKTVLSNKVYPVFSLPFILEHAAAHLYNNRDSSSIPAVCLASVQTCRCTVLDWTRYPAMPGTKIGPVGEIPEKIIMLHFHI